MNHTLLCWYNIGTLLLALGLLWMFLPHTAHQAILSDIEEAEHYIHIIQGTIVTLAGLGLMVLEQRRTTGRDRSE